MLPQDKMDVALNVLSVALGVLGTLVALNGNYAHAAYLMASACWVKP